MRHLVAMSREEYFDIIGAAFEEALQNSAPNATKTALPRFVAGQESDQAGKVFDTQHVPPTAPSRTPRRVCILAVPTDNLDRDAIEFETIEVADVLNLMLEHHRERENHRPRSAGM